MSQKRPFEIRKVYKNVWLFEFTDKYDMAMHFVRFQEYYESPNPDFQGKRFKLFDFMRWYSKEYGDGVFTYPEDWCGFNVPAKVIHDCYTSHRPAWHDDRGDLNEYDETMRNALMEKGIWDGDYVIGALVGDTETVNHETAHGIFHGSQGYRFEMKRITKTMEPGDRDAWNVHLAEMGYAEMVFEDEIQAYMATAIPEELEHIESLQKLRPLYEEVFQKYLQRMSE